MRSVDTRTPPPPNLLACLRLVTVKVGIGCWWWWSGEVDPPERADHRRPPHDLEVCTKRATSHIMVMKKNTTDA